MGGFAIDAAACNASGMSAPITLPEIPEEERTPLVEGLVKLVEELADRVHAQEETIGRLRDEIAVLKGEKPRPVIKPSKMDQHAGQKDEESSSKNKKRPGSVKRAKTAPLEIHEEKIIQPADIPPGSRFRGYEDYTVQELIMHTHNVRYRLGCWITPEGDWLRGELPKEIQGGHFGPQLVSYILYQHHHAQVTQPLLLEQLREWGIDISAGQIDKLLSKREEAFSAEKAEILRAGLESSRYVTVDDTGARHRGRNGYTTHIGNELFAWFETTDPKHRINFLTLLQAGQLEYRIDANALGYMQGHSLPQASVSALAAHSLVSIDNDVAWQAHLASLDITEPRHVRTATEGALLAGLLKHPSIQDLAIISDDAGQFNILIHGLCWIHAERLIHKLIPLNETHREEIAMIRGQIWDLYAELKQYKQHPCPEQKQTLSDRFDAVFTTKTSFATLNQQLKRLHRNKTELLLVLERPEVPLHTNGSEGDIRERVKKRKVSGGTRSDLGRRCRDTFATLKKTCRKHGLSFWRYLVDRITETNAIPPLPELIRQAAAT
jgi:hypothetical protein